MDGFKFKFEKAVRGAGKVELQRKKHEEEEIRSFIKEGKREETWSRIEQLQNEKRDIVQGYMEWRKKSWQRGGENDQERKDAYKVFNAFEERQDARRLVAGKHGKFEMQGPLGENITLTKGEVMAASEWGIWWKFDRSLSQELQREIMSRQVKAAISEQYDRQIIAFGKVNKFSNDIKRDTYARIEADSEKPMEQLGNGILAEKMLISLLTKEMHDGKLPFSVTAVDIYEDVEHKIDFVITVEDRRRGVHVNEPEHRIGIQFTTSQNLVEKKTKQLEHMKKRMGETDVDEIVLVTMPLAHIRDVFDRWRYSMQGGRVANKHLDPRGPDHLWTAETKKAIIDGLVKGIGLERV